MWGKKKPINKDMFLAYQVAPNGEYFLTFNFPPQASKEAIVSFLIAIFSKRLQANALAIIKETFNNPHAPQILRDQASKINESIQAVLAHDSQQNISVVPNNNKRQPLVRPSQVISNIHRNIGGRQ